MQGQYLIFFTTLVSITAQAQLDLSFNLTAPVVAERKFSPKDLLVSTRYTPMFSSGLRAFTEKRLLVSPELIKLPKFEIQKVLPAIAVFSTNPKTQPVVPAVTPLAAVKEPVLKNSEATAIALLEIEPDEYKMLQGLIYFEIQKKFDVAMSLFIDLKDNSKYKSHSLLKYAESAYALDLHSEYRQAMLNLLSNTQDKVLKQMAAQSVVQNIKAMENSDIEKISPMVEAFNIDISKNDNYLYKQAKYLIKKENLTAAENSLSQISPKSPLYPDSMLLSASLLYRKGEVNKAIAKLEKVIPTVEHDKKNKVRNMLILTLARIYFQKGKYKESYAVYLKLDRSSPLWIQSVVEQAWAQILVGDHIGAAGNMFSLHTEFFKKIYLPETYIVRSVGYLNLCQYGDALHVLTDLDARFKKTHEKLTKFETENKAAQAYYDLVKTWYSNTGLTEINSIPRSFVAELAVHPSFTNMQQRVNDFDDEGLRFTKIATDFSQKDSQLKQRLATSKAEQQTLKNQRASAQQIQSNEIKSFIHELELGIVMRNKDNIKKMRNLAQSRLESEKAVYRNLAAAAIKTRYTELKSVLGKLLEQEEVLAFEVYSGAGEHIRYQMADGKINDRTPAELTPEEKKSYKWKFRGEVWEDEIGHYRSSLKNVCPHDGIAKKGDN